ncbi:DASH complex subunit Spc34 [Fusarium albosuccineum]|uniref:DASH complex subunit SPC34 n=1 Tax=Fusarium albosuccineum TaxID=1237068 RepID=A0A8H4LAC1_9HYPO|nr:DASH complex subunit Spc34 [Fusarium albosuccineum]
MSLISAHLEQIGYSCHGIDSLPFPPPKIFTNALLSNHDITSLIRDTEPHERALFSVPPPPPPSTALKPAEPEKTKSSGRRQTVFNVASGEVTTGQPARTGTGHHPRRQTAVAAVLGGQMHEELRRGEADRKGDVDVNVLLRGAEKLCGVYELPGARERIAALRSKHAHGKNTMAYYEARVADQAEQLASLDDRDWLGDEDDEDEEEEGEVWTEEDLRREEEEAREMEVKKKELQSRLRQMEKDLGGLMRM